MKEKHSQARLCTYKKSDKPADEKKEQNIGKNKNYGQKGKDDSFKPNNNKKQTKGTSKNNNKFVKKHS